MTSFSYATYKKAKQQVVLDELKLINFINQLLEQRRKTRIYKRGGFVEDTVDTPFKFLSPKRCGIVWKFPTDTRIQLFELIPSSASERNVQIELVYELSTKEHMTYTFRFPFKWLIDLESTVQEYTKLCDEIRMKQLENKDK